MKAFSFFGLTAEQEMGVAELGFSAALTAAEAEITVEAEQAEQCSLCKREGRIRLCYDRPSRFYRLLSMLPDFAQSSEELMTEHSELEMLCYMADQSRNAVFNMSGAKEMIRRLALCGFDSLMLYTEDTYELPGYPYFGYLRGRFDCEELRELDAYAAIFGIELIPCIQTLAHLESALAWDQFADLRDTPEALMVGKERTYELIDAMLGTCAACFTSRRINIGMDEALMLGRGNYLKENGYKNRSELMFEHLGRVVKLCEKHGFSVLMWSDMFFRMAYNGWYHECTEPLPQEIADAVPANVTPIYWDYGNTTPERFRGMLKSHLRFKAPAMFAGGAQKWHGFAPANRVSNRITEYQLDICREEGVRRVIVTGWGDGGAEASQFSILASLLYYAERAYGDRPTAGAMERRARECFGIGYEELLMTDLPNDMGEGITGERQIVNPCKYLLLNDPLLGMMDQNLIPGEVSDLYRRRAEQLRPLCTHPTWGYLYATLYHLCSLLELKAELSSKLYAAYRQKDRTELLRLAEEVIPQTLLRLDAFAEAFQAQWLRENKPFGFEIQQQRLGGLRLRLVYARGRILAFLSGQTERIDELEVERLPYRPCDPAHPYFRLWDPSRAVSPAKQN